ncbi:Uncharacterized protein Fot_07604 [Forsythia ovata]|uniref:Uncharacterized protein n=1 Tax=Forsythia ovata TaxID=205694 RepID=A0ABD1X0D2_9LAMI
MCHQMICERDDDQSRPPEMHQMTSHAHGDLRPLEMHQMTSHARGGLRPPEMHQMTSHAQIRRSSNLRKDLMCVRPICARSDAAHGSPATYYFRFPLTWWRVGTPAMVFFSDCCLDMNFQ